MMALEIAVNKEATYLGEISLVAVCCHCERTGCQFLKKVCHAFRAGACLTLWTVCQLAMLADQAVTPEMCESESAR